MATVSVVRVVWVVCDADPASDGCHEQTGDGSIMGGTSTTTKAARQDSRDDGWHVRPGGRDICPDCWEAGAR